MSLTTAKITLPTDVAVGVVNKAADASTIAALSPSTPMLFRNQDYMVFNPSAEAEVVEEGAQKGAYEQTLSAVTAKRVKLQTTTRATSELEWADEDNRAQIIEAIIADHVIRHHDVVDCFGGSTLDSHKNCPRPYIDWDAWAELHDYITGEGEPDMDMNDRITDGYIMDGTTYATVGNCIYWAERNEEKAVNTVCLLADRVHELSEKVESLSIGGGAVDYAALAKAVCDEQAKRMTE